MVLATMVEWQNSLTRWSVSMFLGWAEVVRGFVRNLALFGLLSLSCLSGLYNRSVSS